ncbi:MAG TPA: hypothetical protein VH165_02800 [Kofleriaceae bacterium]|nr:hypothetical protein [Kofleriaceae bacterium]
MSGSVRFVCGAMIGFGAAACGDVKPRDTPDAAVAGDAAVAIDAPAPVAGLPLHVLAATVVAGAPDLVLAAGGAGNPTIDTGNLTINGAPSIYLVRQDPYAVLFTNAFAVQGPLTITGSAPLIVVASDQITLDSGIDLHATAAAPGPGAMTAGTGAGTAGASYLVPSVGERESSGGGGGSYGTLGGPGGTSDTTHTPAGASGVRYGMQPADPLVGGSPGGAGGFGSGTTAQGGAGGGALQLSSAVSIRVSATINAGGGGGGTGGSGLAGGGGGGAGGEILLEAPAITMTGGGTLVANGGGGGGGGANGTMSGTAGSDGAPGPGVATGGTGGIPQGSPGGTGAAGALGSFTEAVSGGAGNSKAGGGGGGTGRIWLRYRAATPPTLLSARISPPAGMDSTLP